MLVLRPSYNRCSGLEMIAFADEAKVGVALLWRHILGKRFRRKRIIRGDYSADLERLTLFFDGFHCEPRADHHKPFYPK